MKAPEPAPEWNAHAIDARTAESRGWWKASAVLVVVTAVIGLPLLAGRVLGGHDIVNYLVHAQQTAANLREGLIFPVWSGGYNAGSGSPVLLFFPPLTSYVDALPVLAGLPVVFGVQWLALLAHLLSGVAAYGWLRSQSSGRSALAGAIVYMIAPYRLVDLYLRSALAEHWAFVFPPLILWAAITTALRPPARAALVSLAVVGLLLSNVPLAVLFGLALGAWYLMSADLAGRRAAVAAGVALGFGLAAFFLIPVSQSSSLLNLDLCFGPAVPALLPSSNTLFAAGPSNAGANAVFSWMVLASFGLTFAGWLLLSKAVRATWQARWTILGAVLCIAATVGPAGPIWDATPVLVNLQFPWRVTAILVLITAAVTARLSRLRAWAVVALAVGLTVPFSGWDRTKEPALFLGQEPQARQLPGTVFPDPFTAWEAGSGGWYWRHHNLVELCLVPSSMPRALFREIAGMPERVYDPIRGRPAVFLEHPEVPVRVLEWGQIRRCVELDAPTDGTLMWRTLWFPQMPVTVDGASWPITVDHATGLVILHLPAGRHRVELRWVASPSLRVARLISSVSLAVLVLLLVWGFAARPPKVRKSLTGGVDEPSC
jgi:hypothetical protein